MGKRKQTKRVHRHAKHGHRQSATVGLINDVVVVLGFILKVVFFVLNIIVKILGAPIRFVGRNVAKVFAEEVKVHPQLKVLEKHYVWSVATGLCMLLLSFAIQNLFHHFVWECAIETTRAAAVCPIWETLSAVLKIPEELA